MKTGHVRYQTDSNSLGNQKKILRWFRLYPIGGRQTPLNKRSLFADENCVRNKSVNDSRFVDVTHTRLEAHCGAGADSNTDEVQERTGTRTGCRRSNTDRMRQRTMTRKMCRIRSRQRHGWRTGADSNTDGYSSGYSSGH